MNSLTAELQYLLWPLTREPVPLSLCEGDTATKDGAAVKADQLALFEKHIGPYEVLLDSAAKHSRLMLEDAIFCFNTSYEPVNYERYAHPMSHAIKGPRPDPLVWVGLFLGKDKEVQLRAQDGEEKESGEIRFEDIHKAIAHKARDLSILQLTRNALLYLQEEAQRLNNSTLLLSFCAIYGLSGAMVNVLHGKYGTPIGIDTVLPLEGTDGVYQGKMCLPAYAIGTVLGHCHVIRQAIQCGAKLDTPSGVSFEPHT
jgi:hypothetical protein